MARVRIFLNVFWAINAALVFHPAGVHAQPSQPDPRDRVEQYLLMFYDRYLPGVNFEQPVHYPKSSRYYFAWANLVVAVGGDFAFVITAGASEVGVKIISAGDKAALALDSSEAVATAVGGKLGDASKDFAVGRAVDATVWATEKYVGSEVPGLRTGIAVYSVFDAAKEEEQRVQNAIFREKEIQFLVGEIALSAASLQSAINSLDSPVQRAKYQQLLYALLQRRAEISVYRQMAWELAVTGDPAVALQIAVMQAINPGWEPNTTIDKSLSRLVEPYLWGELGKTEFSDQLELWIRQQISSQRPQGVPVKQDLDRVRQAIAGHLGRLDRDRASINKYGGGPTLKTTCLASYAALIEMVPEDYRGRATANATSDGSAPARISAQKRGPSVGSSDSRTSPASPPQGGNFFDDAQVLVKAKAILWDQKAIQSGYLRVRAVRDSLLVDGFLRSRSEQTLVEDKLRDIDGNRRLITSFSFLPDLGRKEEYSTKLGEQAKDALLATKWRATIAQAQARGSLSRNLHLAGVDVFLGRGHVFFIGTAQSEGHQIAELLGGNVQL